MGLTRTERLHAVLIGFSTHKVLHLDSFILAPRCKGAGVAAARGEGDEGKEVGCPPRGLEKKRKSGSKNVQGVVGLPLSGR